MTNYYNHLNKLQRDTIEYFINNKKTFTQIASAINKHRTTIAKEIIRNRYSKYSSNNTNTSNCEKLNKPPYVCNSCKSKGGCSKNKLYYNAKVAEEKYNLLLKSSRQGIDIPAKTIEEIESIIVPLIKDKKHSVNQVYANHKDILYFSKPTFYKYVNEGVLSLCNLDLPKKVKYKTRKKKDDYVIKRKLAIQINRSYRDFMEFIHLHPKMNVMEMDTVEGTQDSSKVLLTLIIKKTKFMLIFLLDKKNMACVDEKFKFIKTTLGIKLYAKVFRIILTDNGSEFFNPYMMERDYDNDRKVCNVFYCNPYSSYQKGTIEKNHQYIRKVFPKGTSFDNLNQDVIKKLEDNINNIPRVDLDNKTPYELTKELYPEFITKLDCSFIIPDDVDMSLENIMRNK